MDKTYIIIPNYIVTEELKELSINTINSFRKNSKDIVLVLVDDGSPMDTSFLYDMADIYVRNEENSGFAITCNNGFKRAFEEIQNNGEEDAYIVCANNDIEVYPRWQEEMIFPFNEYDNVAVTGICHSKYKEIDGVHLSEKKDLKIVEGGQAAVMQDGGLWMSKKSILDKVGLFDEQFLRGGYEDVDIFLRMRDTFGMKIIMSERAWYWHKEGATRWNCENNGYINNFGHESKSIESENLDRFIAKWGFNPHNEQIWYTKELVN